MARLPQPGGDDGNWGDILNDYLSQVHKSDGTLKDTIITGSTIATGTISEAKLDSAVQTKLNAAGGATNLASSPTSTNVTITSSTGDDATIAAVTTSNAGVMSATDKTKLDGIAAGAEVNVNADWNAGSGDAQILNKPTIPNITASSTAPPSPSVGDMWVDLST